MPWLYGESVPVTAQTTIAGVGHEVRRELWVNMAVSVHQPAASVCAFLHTRCTDRCPTRDLVHARAQPTSWATISAAGVTVRTAPTPGPA